MRGRLVGGFLMGAMVTLGMVALLYLGGVMAGLPFIPFDLFDFVARVLPGDVITFGIDRMVGVLLALGLGSTLDSAAKLAEQGMAIALFVVLGGLLGVGIFVLLARLPRPRHTLAGIGMGMVAGALLMGVSLAFNRSAAAPIWLQIPWVVGIGAGVGMMLRNAYAAMHNLPQSDGVTVIDRREFIIQLGGATAVLTLVGVGLGALLTGGGSEEAGEFSTEQPTTDSAGNPLPNAGDPLTPAQGTRAEYTPVREHYRIDIVTVPPVVDEARYTLKISGEVANPQNWTLDEIRAMPSQSAFITMSCISNPIAGRLIGTTKWTGVPMQYILDQVQPTPDAVAIRIGGDDGFDEFLALDLIRQDERIMLCYAWDDAPLPVRNGFPLRVHIPDRYGMKQPKWITGMQFVNEMGEGYWVRRGWSKEAIVNATSVIDTVSVETAYTRAGRQYVPIGGMAWAGARGIRAVQVRVDNGDWQEARLRAPLSERTWVLWRYDWAFEQGNHTFEVRCIEADGTPQTERRVGTRPDGATGLHSLEKAVR